MWVSSMPSTTKKPIVATAIPARSVAVCSTARPVSTVKPIRYSEKAAGAIALHDSTLTSFTWQDTRREIQPTAASTNGTRAKPRCVISSHPGASSRHTTDSTVTVKFAIWINDVAPSASGDVPRKPACALRFADRAPTVPTRHLSPHHLKL